MTYPALYTAWGNCGIERGRETVAGKGRQEQIFSPPMLYLDWQYKKSDAHFHLGTAHTLVYIEAEGQDCTTIFAVDRDWQTQRVRARFHGSERDNQREHNIFLSGMEGGRPEEEFLEHWPKELREDIEKLFKDAASLVAQDSSSELVHRNKYKILRRVDEFLDKLDKAVLGGLNID